MVRGKYSEPSILILFCLLTFPQLSPETNRARNPKIGFASSKYSQAKNLKVVHGLIHGLNAPARLADQKQRRFGHSATAPASDAGLLGRSRAEAFSEKSGVPGKLEISG
jgi:hypothetical protein